MKKPSKKVFRRPMPAWPKLVLAVLLLVFSLTMTFHLLGRPMPTPELACFFQERENLWGPAETVAKGTLTYQSPREDFGSMQYPKNGSTWLVRRCGEHQMVSVAERLASLPLWQVAYYVNFTLTAETPVYFASIATQYSYPHSSSDQELELLYLAVTDDPAIARVEGTFTLIPDAMKDDRPAARAEYGVPITFTAVSPGIWEGRSTTPESKASTTFRDTVYRAYSADGALIYDSAAP